MTQNQAVKLENKNRKRTGIIDCDVHVSPFDNDEIKKYMKQPFRDAFRFWGRGIFDNPFTEVRPDAKPPTGGPIGSDPEFLREQLIDSYGTEHAILHPWIYADYYADPDLKAAICSAYNDWLNDTWLSKYNHDGVFKASIVISHQDPSLAVKEIERWAGHPHFVQVLADAGARAPFGQRHYWPIYEACQRHGLPFAYHPGSDGLGSNTPFTPGFPTHFIEWGTTLVCGFISHLVSLLTEGVFERYPGLKVVSLEGGSAWLPAILWRLDSHYKSFRFEVPWVKKLPSLYIRDHVRFGSQPLEKPDDDKHLLYFLEMMDAENIMMFTSDYPHYDTDHPREMFPRNIPEQMKNKILYENAREFYRF
ncbi:amidohydrolase [Peribacillus cavernae]|uniref:Amidohydrolase n=1 Tax=Peribacillus cavernae TaxID=1674310 RepID=A0A3S0U927_9BACI|nr:amidohydrolase family protein [Peribacillus cavernae]MDQ0218068.1 putative TIM-barrel fold metal-dependent hydrolase [Peribacillus cavernae]RUQ32772.1 amidohydrolase [Peribacillus cavernae]